MLVMLGVGRRQPRSNSFLTKEKWVGQDCQLFVWIAKATLMQVEFHSLVITQSSGDDVKDQQFGRDCELGQNNPDYMSSLRNSNTSTRQNKKPRYLPR